jgi:hypothetical protein
VGFLGTDKPELVCRKWCLIDGYVGNSVCEATIPLLLYGLNCMFSFIFFCSQLCFVFCFVGFLKDSVRVFAGVFVAEEKFDLDGYGCGSALDVSSNVLRGRLRGVEG